jgi:hypothetical protein
LQAAARIGQVRRETQPAPAFAAFAEGFAANRFASWGLVCSYFVLGTLLFKGAR